MKKRECVNFALVNIEMGSVALFYLLIRDALLDKGFYLQIIGGDQLSDFKDLGRFNCIIVDPVKCGEIDKEIIDIISKGKENNLQVVAVTTSENAGKTVDSAFEALDIKEIIRIPASREKLTGALFKK